MNASTHRLRLPVLLLLAGLLLLLSGCEAGQQEAEGKGMLRVGVRTNVAGLGCQNPNTGRYYGLEIDLARALARRLGYEDAAFVSVTPETRETVLESGQADCVIACFSVTEDRKKRVDFSQPYYTDRLRILAERSSLIRTVRDLRGCTIAVMKDTNAMETAEEGLRQAGLLLENQAVRMVEMSSYEDMDRALETGAVDAICMDGIMAHGYEGERISLALRSSESEYAVATRRGSALSKPLDEALGVLLEEGFVDQLIREWL